MRGVDSPSREGNHWVKIGGCVNKIFGVATYVRDGNGYVRSRLQHYTDGRVASFVARGMISPRAGIMLFTVTGSGDVWMDPEVLKTYGDCPSKPV